MLRPPLYSHWRTLGNAAAPTALGPAQQPADRLQRARTGNPWGEGDAAGAGANRQRMQGTRAMQRARRARAGNRWAASEAARQRARRARTDIPWGAAEATPDNAFRPLSAARPQTTQPGGRPAPAPTSRDADFTEFGRRVYGWRRTLAAFPRRPLQVVKVHALPNWGFPAQLRAPRSAKPDAPYTRRPNSAKSPLRLVRT